MKSDKLPQVMSHESVLIGSEDYKFKNKIRDIFGSAVLILILFFQLLILSPTI